MFSTKQYVLMILAFPIHYEGFNYVNPTLRQIKEALKFYTGIDVTRRQIRNLLRELTDQGIIEREFHFLHCGPLGNQGQANSYKVVDFNKAFQDIFTLIESSKVVLARERQG
ncbi:hypothetical protein ES703_116063 [subsurface metagenome]